jgi:hypothetical protein
MLSAVRALISVWTVAALSTVVVMNAEIAHVFVEKVASALLQTELMSAKAAQKAAAT